MITQADIESLFGTTNISGDNGWADLNNDGTGITARITTAINYAESRFKSQLSGSRYAVPSSISGLVSEPLLVNIIATFAGDYLYRASGGLQDTDEVDRVGLMMESVERDMRMILLGTLRVDLTLSHTGPTAPVVVTSG